MPTIDYQGRRIETASSQTVLDALLDAGIAHPFACRTGVCQSCLVRSRSGAAPASAQHGLPDTLKARGFFLACIAPADRDLELEPPGESGLEIDARLESVELADPIGSGVVIARFGVGGRFDCRAGQYLQLARADGLTRAYSIANLPDEDGFLEIHVKVLRGGSMSGHLATEARPGDAYRIRGPAGDCFYIPGRSEQPLVLAGTSTGIAPLLGIARDALRQGHRGPISIFHGALDGPGLYARKQLDAIARAGNAVTVRYSALNGGADGIASTPLDELVLGSHPDLSGHRVFLCGAPAFVDGMRKRVFLAGASMREIHADAFITRPAAPPS